MADFSVYICEDHQIVVDGIRSILSGLDRSVSIVSFKSGEELLTNLGNERPNLLILDLNLPDLNGLEVLSKIREFDKELPILVLTMHSDPYVVKQVKKLGANGYLLKDFGEDQFLKALEEVLKGGYYQSPSVEIDEEKGSRTGSLRLTEREKEIIRLSAEGKSSAEIAETLFLSPHTINTHRRNIYKKLRINNIKELVKFAYDEGLA